ncbi:MAG: RNA methyltransferase [Planctomycetales bacterium]|nr:RNA methyltransferase [Planctomycetales bacterium]
MLTRKQLKQLRSLRSKKQRSAQGQFLAEGETIVDEILVGMPAELQWLLCSAEYEQRLSAERRSQLGDRLVCCDAKTLAAVSALSTPSPVLAVLHMPQPASGVLDSVSSLALYLDGIRDPGNLGTILRAADWFGVSRIYLSDDCVDLYNPKVIQASMGAFLRVTVAVGSLLAIRAAQPELEIAGARVQGGSDALRYAWPRDTLLVIGSESHGIRSENEAAISQWLTIPRGPHASGSESLNAAMATGILCASYVAWPQGPSE